MASVRLFSDLEGTSKNVELKNTSLIEKKVNKQVIFDSIMVENSSERQGTHSTLSKGEVRGGGRKPYRQKHTGRAHRIGQKNVVEVIKLISQGTVEEKVITMQETKKELINQVMEGDFKEGSFLSNLSKEEIQGLFQLN